MILDMLLIGIENLLISRQSGKNRIEEMNAEHMTGLRADRSLEVVQAVFDRMD